MKMKRIISIIITLLMINGHQTIHSIDGKFHSTIEARNYMDEDVTLYQFKSYDNSVWWLLTENQIGEIPCAETTYTLVYDDNGTTAENKSCDCLVEWECECELYDDEFIMVFES